jgi:glutaconate CoA-transferase, subunit B
MADPQLSAFLARAAQVYDEERSVFTGFHWPVLAGELAGRLRPGRFAQYFEAGFSTTRSSRMLPTSTTDHDAFGGTRSFVGTSADVLLALAPRFDAVVLDAVNVDIRGRVNSTAIGPVRRPRVRMPGGGGAADVAARARLLILLHGGTDPDRIQDAVEHVTAAPGPETAVRLITRWGVLELGAAPRALEIVSGPGTDEFLIRLGQLGVPADGAVTPPAHSRSTLHAADRVIEDAAARGYLAAAKALAGAHPTTGAGRPAVRGERTGSRS